MLVALFVALNLADAGITLALVRLGAATEGNPVMAAALDLGPAAFLLVKALGAGLGALVAARRPRALRVLCGVFALIVAWNAAQLAAW